MISIIVPVYNVEKYIDRCVRSILGQDYGDFELILVDDGSPDDCGRICDGFSESDERVRVIHKANGGVSDARNAGIDVAKGEYLSFVDSDDYVEPTYLSYLLSLIAVDERCKAARANHYIERGEKTTTNGPVTGQVAVLSRKEALEAALYHDQIDIASWGALYHRSVFENIRFPKGMLFEDTYIFSDILSGTEVYVYGDRPQYHYIQRDGSVVNSSFSLKNLEFIEAVQRLTDCAQEAYPSLERACHRRIAHSYLNVLRYMEHVDGELRDLRDELREKALRYSKEVCDDPKAPQRDKVALKLLKYGYLPYYKAWNLYSVLRP